MFNEDIKIRLSVDGILRVSLTHIPVSGVWIKVPLPPPQIFRANVNAELGTLPNYRMLQK